MTSAVQDRSIRFARWWVRRYTAGLAFDQAATRRAEIDSDLAEHRGCRELDGWTARRIARERVARLARGMPSDVRWRRDVLRGNANRGLETAVTAVTGSASLLLAAFHLLFAAYMLGSSSLADQRFLGGMASYADEVGRPVASPIAAMIIASFGVVLAIATLARPISPTMANIATTTVAIWSVLWFWLGMWPVGLVAVIGSVADLAIRSPQTPRP